MDVNHIRFSILVSRVMRCLFHVIEGIYIGAKANASSGKDQTEFSLSRSLQYNSTFTIIRCVQGHTVESLDSVQLCEELIHHPVRHSRAVVTSPRGQRVKLIEEQNTRPRTGGSAIQTNQMTGEAHLNNKPQWECPVN